MDPLTLVGALGSPYTRKLRAVLRYRRLPHRFVPQGSPESMELPEPKVPLIPRLIVDGEARTDSTPLIRALEAMEADREIIPKDPAAAFLDALIEDYADEWVTKLMFHYRWAYAADADKSSTLLPLHSQPQLEDAARDAMSAYFRERQIGRLALVGSTSDTAPILEGGYRALLGILDSYLGTSRFLMGDRPGASDFALHGQLSQLTSFDPTSAAIALREAPRVVAWTDLVDDLSGVAPGSWRARDELFVSLKPLMVEIGRSYAPFLVANAHALETGQATVKVSLEGQLYTQAPFRYQGKCLKVLQDAFKQLGGSDQAFVKDALDGTGCENLLR